LFLSGANLIIFFSLARILYKKTSLPEIACFWIKNQIRVKICWEKIYYLLLLEK
jgi:hypothetical protein